jgi:DNA polymerase-4
MKKQIKKIIHIDMDAYFASIEQRDNPDLIGKPVAVGGSMHRGVVAAASYEARKFGVHSAMSIKLALQKCPHLIIVKGRYDVYKSVSEQIMRIFHSYTDLVEPLSLDEAFLDVTNNKISSATQIAREIKNKIKEETHLTASAGVSFNKFLAKVASDFKKPDGLTVITPEKADDFVNKLPVGKIPGIGKVTEGKMKKLGIHTGTDLKAVSKYFLSDKFGKMGAYYYDLIRFNYDSPVQTENTRKSVGSETTFDVDIFDINDLLTELKHIVSGVARRLQKLDIMGKTVTLKIKYYDFVIHTRSRTMKHLIQNESEIFEITKELLLIPLPPIKPVRLLGVQISNLDSQPKNLNQKQLSLDFYKVK